MSDPNTQEGAGSSKDPVHTLGNFFASLDKAIRGVRLYRGEGSVVSRQMEDLREKAKVMLREEDVTVRVAPFGLLYQGAPVTPSEKRIAYLFRLYCDGVRELTFQRGLGEVELRTLVDVLGSESVASDEDMVTTLWKANLKHIRYYAVDAFTGTTDVGSADAQALGQTEAGRLQRGGAGDVEIALTSDDIRLLRTEDLLDWVREARAPALPLGLESEAARKITDRYDAERSFARFLDIAVRAADPSEEAPASPLVLGVFDALLAAGKADGVVEMLERVAQADERSPAPLRHLRAAVLEEERLIRLAPLYAERHEPFLPALRALAARDGGGLVRLLTQVPTGPAEAALQLVLGESGLDLTPFYLRRLESEDEAQILAAVTALGRIGSPDAVQALCNALSSILTSVRRGALEALQGKYHESARVALGRVLRDPDKANRLLAFRILSASGDSRVCWSLLSFAQKPDFMQADADEQRAVYSALAAFRDKRTLGHFGEVLADRNLTRNKEVITRQEIVVDALSEMGTPEARELIEQSRGKWHLPKVVKQSIEKALSRFGRAQ